jgi:hypothetical protein
MEETIPSTFYLLAILNIPLRAKTQKKKKKKGNPLGQQVSTIGYQDIQAHASYTHFPLSLVCTTGI